MPAANAHRAAGRDAARAGGALVEPLTVGFTRARLAALDPDAGVLVVGGGIIGLGAALAARRRVGDRVLVLEPRAERRALAGRLGLRAAAPGEVGRRGVRRACSTASRGPRPSPPRSDAVVTGGDIVLVGIWEDEIPLPVSAGGRGTRPG